MIAITGATGQLGHLVIHALLNKVSATQVVAIVRNLDKAQDLAALGVQLRQADYNQADGWDAALQGVDKLLLISSSEVGQRTAQHQTVIDAARRAQVKLLAYTSLLHADTSVLGLGSEHRETEAAIRASGVPFVLLRNGWYSENYAMSVGAALSLGALYGSTGEGRIASAHRADYAEAAAVVLTREQQAGKVYELAGDNAYTLSEFAAEISAQSGKTVPYVNLPQAEYQQALIGAGLPDGLAAMLADSDDGAARGGLFDDGHQLSALIGRPTTAWQLAVSAALQ